MTCPNCEDDPAVGGSCPGCWLADGTGCPHGDPCIDCVRAGRVSVPPPDHAARWFAFRVAHQSGGTDGLAMALVPKDGDPFMAEWQSDPEGPVLERADFLDLYGPEELARADKEAAR